MDMTLHESQCDNKLPFLSI